MSEIIVTVKEGILQGKKEISVRGDLFYSFKGIPYAKPPVGNLRFKAPQPPEPWTGILDATEHRSINFQYSPWLNEPPKNESEDCLYLNVYCPQNPNTKQNNMKPVIVWIHGGAFVVGSGNAELYGPDYILSEDIIFVTLNYRLGIFGFLRVDDPAAEIPGNAGMKDIVMALQWVKDNISNFGGDPNNITIYGHSAGAVAVHLLMLSPLAKGLFHQAIVIGAFAFAMWALIPPEIKPLTEISKVLNLHDKNEINVVQKLYGLPAKALLKAEVDINFTIGDRLLFGPTVEHPSNNSFLPDEPINIIRSGDFNKVPTIFGYTSREGMFFKKVGDQFLTRDIEDFVPFNFGLPKGSHKSKEIADRIRKFYYDGDMPSLENVDITYTLLTDTYFLNPLYQSIRELITVSSENVYLYRFSVDGRNNIVKKMNNIILPGATHGDNNFYQFVRGKLSPKTIPFSLEDITIRRLSKFTANFAKYKDPNAGEKTELIKVNWKPISKDEFNYLEFGENLTVGIDPDMNRQQFWDEITNFLNQ